jgi:hypothetical protein
MDQRVLDGIWWALFGELSYEEVIEKLNDLQNKEA